MGTLAHTESVSLILLNKLAKAPLPATVTSGEEIDGLRILSLAGLVKASIPPPQRTLTGYDQPAGLALEITRLGHSMLQRFPAN